MRETAAWTYWLYPLAACIFAALVFVVVDNLLLVTPVSRTRVAREGHSMWTFAASWAVVAIVGPGLVLLGFGVLSMTPAEVKFSQACFAVGYLVILARIVFWVVFERTDPTLERATFTGLTFLVIGVLWFSSARFALTKNLVIAGRSQESPRGSGPKSSSTPINGQEARVQRQAQQEAGITKHKREQPSPERTTASPSLRAYLQPDEPYFDGTLLGGIVWSKNYVDVRLDVSSGPQDLRNLDFLVSLDTSIAGLGQISQFQGVSAFPAKQLPAAWIEGTTPDGKPISVPMIPLAGMIQAAPVYRVRCSEIFSNTTVHFVVASIALNPPGPHGELPQQLFAPRRAPRQITAEGTYEVGGRGYPIKFSYTFP
jgi:hypothetical protein